MIYNSLKKALLDAGVNLGSDTIKVMLLTSSYSPDQDLDEFIDDISANEVSGTGYTAGGQALAGKATSQDNTNDRGKWDADDVTWTTSTITARYAAYYKDTGTPATSRLICVKDFGSDKISSAGNFTIQHHADGIMYLG